MFVALLDLFSANDRLSTSLQWVCWAQSFGINDRFVGTWLCCEIKITVCRDLFWHLEMMIMEQIDSNKKYSMVAAMSKCSHHLMSSWQHGHHHSLSMESFIEVLHYNISYCGSFKSKVFDWWNGRWFLFWGKSVKRSWMSSVSLALTIVVIFSISWQWMKCVRK